MNTNTFQRTRDFELEHDYEHYLMTPESCYLLCFKQNVFADHVDTSQEETMIMNDDDDDEGVEGKTTTQNDENKSTKITETNQNIVAQKQSNLNETTYMIIMDVYLIGEKLKFKSLVLPKQFHYHYIHQIQIKQTNEDYIYLSTID